MYPFNTIVFDTETTGLIKPGAVDIDQQPYIIDIFCLKVKHNGPKELEVIDTFESLVKPPVPITAEINRITGIYDKDVENAPVFIEIQGALANFFLGTTRIVAHNLAFDRGMLTNELFRCDKVLKFPWPIEHICSVEKTMYIEQRRMNLQRLHQELFGEGFADAHRAKPDVMALYRCYEELVKRGII
jgi:DNA polymerase III epsilon subunit-like protein